MKNELERKFGVRILYITESGSKLYGTNDEQSDTDYKCIFVPNEEELLLNSANMFYKANSNSRRDSKNTNEDVDCDLDSIHKWLGSVSKGETGALDILFSIFHKQSTVYIDEEFEKVIRANYIKLLCKRPQAFIGYCVGQAKKYSIKGERYNELLEFIKKFYIHSEKRLDEKLKVSWKSLEKWVTKENYRYIKMVRAPGPRKSTEIDYIEVLGRKFSGGVTAQFLCSKLTELEQSYGSRAKGCDTNVEWKSLSHAVRVIDEVEELLTDRCITFPLKNKDYIYKIKRGGVELDNVIAYIETSMKKVDMLIETSELPLRADEEFMKELILRNYRKDK